MWEILGDFREKELSARVGRRGWPWQMKAGGEQSQQSRCVVAEVGSEHTTLQSLCNRMPASVQF